MPKATQLDMAKTNSKPRQAAFESNIKSNVFMLELNIKILTQSKQEKQAIVLAYLQIRVTSELGLQEQRLAFGPNLAHLGFC